MADVFESLPAASWQADGKDPIAFPVLTVRERMTRRVTPRRRAYKTGAKLDGTGRDHLVWELESLFHNGNDEVDTPTDLYPDHLEKLLTSLEADETGTLTLPTRGPVRAKLKEWARTDAAEPRDAAKVDFTFWEDNEDTQVQTGFNKPSAKSSSQPTSQEATEALESAGAYSEDVGSLEELASGLESLANAPDEYLSQLEQQANQVIAAGDRIVRAFSNAASSAANEVTKLITDPENSRAGAVVKKLMDLAGSARVRVGARVVVSKTYPRDLSVFDVSVDAGQSSDDLIALNPQLPDLYFIKAGTPVRMYQDV